MDSEETILKKAFAALKAAEAAPLPPPPKARQALEQSLKMHVQPRLVSQPEMEMVLLKLLQDSPGEGGDLIQRLQTLKLRLANPGDGVIYGLLNTMERACWIEGRWREVGLKMIKTYHFTGSGSARLLNSQEKIAFLGLSAEGKQA